MMGGEADFKKSENLKLTKGLEKLIHLGGAFFSHLEMSNTLLAEINSLGGMNTTFRFPPSIYDINGNIIGFCQL